MAKRSHERLGRWADMATEVLVARWCDQCILTGERVEGRAWSVTITEPGGKPASYKLDACELHGKPLAELVAELAENARRESHPESADSTVGRTCPVCGFVSAAHRHLNEHLKRKHSTSLAELDGSAHLPCPIAGCSRKFGREVGRHQHVRTGHPEQYPAWRLSQSGEAPAS